MERNGPHKYNTRSRTKRVNYETTFKTAPNMFKTDAAEKITTHKGTDYLARIDPKKDTITVEPIATHINWETTGNIFGYRDLLKIDALVWTNSMRNYLSRLSQGWNKYDRKDTIEFIFHTENTAANSIVNGMEKQKRSRAIDMRFYWVRDIIRQTHLHVFWEEGKKNLAYCVTKHHPIWHRRTMRSRSVKSTQK